MTTHADSWLMWCGRGDRPRPPAATNRHLGTVRGPGARSFAGFDVDGAPGHARLQFAARGNVAVALGGWLVNCSDLLARIGAPGVAPANDAEVVLQRYIDSGSDAVADLRGQFVVAIWDGDQDTLIAQRDPMGLHSLFWAESANSIYLSDSLDALLRCEGVSQDLNRVALADALRDFWPDSSETVYTAIRRVPAGHRLTDQAGRRRVERSWRPATGSQVGWASPDEVAEFDDRFATAVTRCLQRGPVGIWLSGGLDSVSVAAVAAEHADKAGAAMPIALSLRFPDPGVNEEDVQRSVARQLGFPSVMLGLEEAVAPDSVIRAALRLSGDWPAPMLGPWLPAYLTLGTEGRDRGCQGILTGHGGDEWLTVSPYYGADLLAAFDIGGFARLVGAARRSLKMPAWRVLHTYLWRCAARPLLRRGATTLAPGLLERRDRRQFIRTTPEWLAPDPELKRELDARFVPRLKVSNFYDDELKKSLDHPLVSIELEEWHEAGRRMGVPVLSPFLDVDLVELLYRIHPDVLNRGGRSKGLVRSTVDRRFPQLAFGQDKKVQAFPTLLRLLAQEGDRLARLDSTSALAELGIVDIRRFEEAAREALDHGTLRRRWALFHVQSIEAFARARTSASASVV